MDIVVGTFAGLIEELKISWVSIKGGDASSWIANVLDKENI